MLCTGTMTGLYVSVGNYFDGSNFDEDDFFLCHHEAGSFTGDRTFSCGDSTYITRYLALDFSKSSTRNQAIVICDIEILGYLGRSLLFITTYYQ